MMDEVNYCNRCGRMIKTWCDYVTTDDANDDDTYHIKCAGLLVIDLRAEIGELKESIAKEIKLAADWFRHYTDLKAEIDKMKRCENCEHFTGDDTACIGCDETDYENWKPQKEKEGEK